MRPIELDIKIRSHLPSIAEDIRPQAVISDRVLYYMYMSAAVDVLRPKLVIDIGTENGFSALALNTPQIGQLVRSYDIIEDKTIWQDDIEYNIRNILDDTPAMAKEYSQADLIFLDIDPHDGIKERAMMRHLFKYLDSGRTVWMFFDDVTSNNGMAEFWYWLRNQPGVEAMDIGERVDRNVVGFGLARITT